LFLIFGASQIDRQLFLIYQYITICVRAEFLTNVINIETFIKSEKVVDRLCNFSEDRKMLETKVGYRIYCRDAETAIPEIVRSLDEIGCKATRIETIKPSLKDVFFKLTGRTIKEVS